MNFVINHFVCRKDRRYIINRATPLAFLHLARRMNRQPEITGVSANNLTADWKNHPHPAEHER